ncbi:MAG: GNAT family N-acetyltransferase [Aliivibrio sp.]|uniref:GNAT family N-acetyltransferase n=1 Tax=Aliivibrio sp. TaxID=1872443 RepID=UPI001A4DC3E4|nr:GNAT family N-acetyltransferase [Aliivibrio sp.]
MEFTFSKVTEKDKNDILRLGESVNESCVVPFLNEEGKKAMRQARSPDILEATNVEIYEAIKAVVDGELIGYIAWRQGNYIAQLYVSTEYQGCGVGSRLVNEMKARSGAVLIQLKASINAIGFYKKLGFVATSKEQNKNGIRFVPMERI